jgi:hypothetical protein
MALLIRVRLGVAQPTEWQRIGDQIAHKAERPLKRSAII